VEVVLPRIQTELPTAETALDIRCREHTYPSETGDGVYDDPRTTGLPVYVSIGEIESDIAVVSVAGVRSPVRELYTRSSIGYGQYVVG